MQGLNAAEREAIENQKRVESREKRIAETRSDALTFQKNAAEKLKMGDEVTFHNDHGDLVRGLVAERALSPADPAHLVPRRRLGIGDVPTG
jgi:transcription elongation GreA/GreB family factor